MTAVSTDSRRHRWALLVVALAFLLPFGWELLGAISNLLAWVGLATRTSATLTSFAWAVLVLGILVPIAAYVAATVVLRGHTARAAALTLLVSFCASQALTLSLIGLFYSGIGAN